MIRNIDRLIFKDLYKNKNGLFLFTFYSRYKIEPDQIAVFIKKYNERELLFLKDDKVFLTEKGKKFVLTSFNLLITEKTKTVPTDFIGKNISINEPYIPKIRMVSDEIMNFKEGGIETSIKEV